VVPYVCYVGLGGSTENTRGEGSNGLGVALATRKTRLFRAIENSAVRGNGLRRRDWPPGRGLGPTKGNAHNRARLAPHCGVAPAQSGTNTHGPPQRSANFFEFSGPGCFCGPSGTPQPTRTFQFCGRPPQLFRGRPSLLRRFFSPGGSAYVVLQGGQIEWRRGRMSNSSQQHTMRSSGIRRPEEVARATRRGPKSCGWPQTGAIAPRSDCRRGSNRGMGENMRSATDFCCWGRIIRCWACRSPVFLPRATGVLSHTARGIGAAI